MVQQKADVSARDGIGAVAYVFAGHWAFCGLFEKCALLSVSSKFQGVGVLRMHYLGYITVMKKKLRGYPV